VNRGAVAIVDALGFKGVWDDPNRQPTAVLAALKEIGEAARTEKRQASLYLDRRTLPDEVAKNLKDPFMKIVQLSDTIVVAAGRRPRKRRPWKRHADDWDKRLRLTVDQLEDAVDGYLRYIVCRCVCSILKVAALCDPALIYRGAVTAGDFAIDKHFLLGPAIDEAAELMEMADGPFVWLAPSADRLKHTIREARKDAWGEMAIRHSVPLKGGRRLPTRVLNPFVFCTAKERQAVEASIDRRMTSSKIDVLVKRGNWREFLGEIKRRERMKEYVAKHRSKKAADGETSG
jgi:hypothetical protein